MDLPRDRRRGATGWPPRPQPARVFEYGSGASTSWLARRSGSRCTASSTTPGSRRSWTTCWPTCANAERARCGRRCRPRHRRTVGQGGLRRAWTSRRTSTRSTRSTATSTWSWSTVGPARRVSTKALERLGAGRDRRLRQHPAASLPPCDRGGAGGRAPASGLTPTLPYPDQTSLLRARLTREPATRDAQRAGLRPAATSAQQRAAPRDARATASAGAPTDRSATSDRDEDGRRGPRAPAGASTATSPKAQPRAIPPHRGDERVRPRSRRAARTRTATWSP